MAKANMEDFFMAKSIKGWFNSQSRLVQILLLLIPVVNWFVEIVVRWSSAINTKKTLNIIAAIVVTFFGLFVGWVDVIWCLIFKHMLFAD